MKKIVFFIFLSIVFVSCHNDRSIDYISSQLVKTKGNTAFFVYHTVDCEIYKKLNKKYIIDDSINYLELEKEKYAIYCPKCIGRSEMFILNKISNYNIQKQYSALAEELAKDKITEHEFKQRIEDIKDTYSEYKGVARYNVDTLKYVLKHIPDDYDLKIVKLKNKIPADRLIK